MYVRRTRTCVLIWSRRLSCAASLSASVHHASRTDVAYLRTRAVRLVKLRLRCIRRCLDRGVDLVFEDEREMALDQPHLIRVDVRGRVLAVKFEVALKPKTEVSTCHLLFLPRFAFAFAARFGFFIAAT